MELKSNTKITVSGGIKQIKIQMQIQSNRQNRIYNLGILLPNYKRQKIHLNKIGFSQKKALSTTNNIKNKLRTQLFISFRIFEALNSMNEKFGKCKRSKILYVGLQDTVLQKKYKSKQILYSDIVSCEKSTVMKQELKSPYKR